MTSVGQFTFIALQYSKIGNHSKEHQHLALKHRLIPKKEVLVMQYCAVLFILELCTK